MNRRTDIIETIADMRRAEVVHAAIEAAELLELPPEDDEHPTIPDPRAWCGPCEEYT